LCSSSAKTLFGLAIRGSMRMRLKALFIAGAI
jgi:hypothetical protein